jgi:transcriptional regulator with XRE-family HTH domain
MTPNQRVKHVRKKLGLNQVEFSKALDITQSYLSEIENAKDKRGKPLSVSEEVRRKLWNTFSVNVNWIMAGGEDSEMFLTEKSHSMYQNTTQPSDVAVTALHDKLEKYEDDLSRCREQKDLLLSEVEHLRAVVLNLSKGQ